MELGQLQLLVRLHLPSLPLPLPRSAPASRCPAALQRASHTCTLRRRSCTARGLRRPSQTRARARAWARRLRGLALSLWCSHLQQLEGHRCMPCLWTGGRAATWSRWCCRPLHSLPSSPQAAQGLHWRSLVLGRRLWWCCGCPPMRRRPLRPLLLFLNAPPVLRRALALQVMATATMTTQQGMLRACNWVWVCPSACLCCCCRQACTCSALRRTARSQRRARLPLPSLLPLLRQVQVLALQQLTTLQQLLRRRSARVVMRL